MVVCVVYVVCVVALVVGAAVFNNGCFCLFVVVFALLWSTKTHTKVIKHLDSCSP